MERLGEERIELACPGLIVQRVEVLRRFDRLQQGAVVVDEDIGHFTGGQLGLDQVVTLRTTRAGVVLTVILGLAAWKASITAFELATSVSVVRVRSVISVAAGARRLRHCCRNFRRYSPRTTDARGARSHQRNAAPAFLVNLMEPPG